MRLKITTKNFVKVYIRLICVFLLQDNLSPLLFAKMVKVNQGIIAELRDQGGISSSDNKVMKIDTFTVIVGDKR